MSIRTFKQEPASSRDHCFHATIRDAMICPIGPTGIPATAQVTANRQQRADRQITANGWPQIGLSQTPSCAVAIGLQIPFSNLLMILTVSSFVRAGEVA